MSKLFKIKKYSVCGSMILVKGLMIQWYGGLRHSNLVMVRSNY